MQKGSLVKHKTLHFFGIVVSDVYTHMMENTFYCVVDTFANNSISRGRKIDGGAMELVIL